MTNRFIILLAKIVDVVDKCNDELLENMMSVGTKYDNVCIGYGITYDWYLENLKRRMEKVMNHRDEEPVDVGNVKGGNVSITGELPSYADDMVNKYGARKVKSMISAHIEKFLLGPIDKINYTEFKLDDDIKKTAVSFVNSIGNDASGYFEDMFRYLMKLYRSRYAENINIIGGAELNNKIRGDYVKTRANLRNLTLRDVKKMHSTLMDVMATTLTNIYSFRIESELDELIPDEIGPMKQFFKKVIGEYYSNLHPIIWAQIVKSVIKNFAIEKPFTHEELYAFASKHILLNSGPFILKILQMVRPALSPELAKKYNLTKLSYPLLDESQVDYILDTVMVDRKRYGFVRDFSASVGHVVKMEDRVDNVKIIIKIIKPIAIAQSCWEYSALTDIFPRGTCEHNFIKSMISSTGAEFNVNQEIKNLIDGNKYYTATYNDVYGVNLDARLAVINHLPGVIKDGPWNVLAMSLAPGAPLSHYVENNIVGEKDTIFRSNLHRCLDILVAKFFINIIQNGFYHGDLHSGNVFYSFETNIMTLIDFGAVGKMDLYDGSADIEMMIQIIIGSSYSNFTGVLSDMTDLLNSKCDGSERIDKESDEYIKFHNKLDEYRYNNISILCKEKAASKKYGDHMFSAERFEMEGIGMLDSESESKKDIYQRMNKTTPEDAPEFKDVIKDKFQLDESGSVTFDSVLGDILEFFAKNGVNLAVKANEFYEFQKAYALLLGILHSTGYVGYRTGIAIESGIKTAAKSFIKSPFKTVLNSGTLVFATKFLFAEKSRTKEYASKHGLNIDC